VASEELDNNLRIEQLWLVARKLFRFEEPARKLAQLKKWAEKIATLRTPLDTAGLVQTTIDDAFRSCSYSAGDRAFSVAWAAWYMHRFTEPSLSASFPHGFAAQVEDADITQFGSLLRINEPALAWCQLLANSRLPWHVLSASSAQDDPRVKFVHEFMRRYKPGVDARNDANSLKDAVLVFDQVLREHRGNLDAAFLPNAILLVEGATELVLVPKIADCLEMSCNALGLHVIGAGGANQVAKRFEQLHRSLRLPIFCLLDKDATEQAKSIRQKLRLTDRLFVIEDGEIEDTIETTRFVALLNEYMQGALVSSKPIQNADFDSGRKTEVAQKLLRLKASLDFDKVKFAGLIAQSMKNRNDIPLPLRHIFDNIRDLITSAGN
jgi:hypothetical protein